jgi:hypothetical protein
MPKLEIEFTDGTEIKCHPAYRERKGKNQLNGVTFEFPDGRIIRCYLNTNRPGRISIDGEDRLLVYSEATNLVSVKLEDRS